MEIDHNDIRVFTYSSRREGNWLPSYENGVHLIHLPSGIEIKEHSDKCPHKNKVIAIDKLKTMLEERWLGCQMTLNL